MFKKLILLSISILVISCGENASGDAGVDGVSDSQHRIFVSSMSYDGNLGGLTGADSKCNSLASAAGLEREYKAFIGSGSSSLKSRFNLIGAVYNFTGDNRERIVSLGADLFDADVEDLLRSIDYDENGNTVSAVVWTGSDSEGENSLISDCSDWTSNSGGANGSVGDNTRTTGFFLEDPPVQACSGSYRIYCISI
jgi:hypothetical protein